MAKKKLTTTRDTKLNYSDLSDGFRETLDSITATKDYKNLKLLGVSDGLKVDGQKILDQTKLSNQVMKESGSEVFINTGGITSGQTYYIYGAPFKNVLLNKQRYNNCGVASTFNNLVMAGKEKIKESVSAQKKTEKEFLKEVWNLGLAGDDGVIGVLDEPDGGTTPADYKEIFGYYGIDSEAYFIAGKNVDGKQYNNIAALADIIKKGCGAVVGVCADLLWQEAKYDTADPKELEINHAISLTGVVCDKDNKLIGFYIHDTGAWMSRYITLNEFKEITLYDLYGEGHSENVTKKTGVGIFVTFTNDPIKADSFDNDATGDKQDNIIFGNSGSNIIKGLDGKDVLYGGAGNDEVRGGKGDDIIFGNGVVEDYKEVFDDIKVKARLATVSPVKGEPADWSLEGINILYGDAGSDIIFGGNQTDLIYGGAGNDYIYTGEGRNAVYAGAGNDFILGGDDNDRIFGGDGKDIIYAYDDDDVIHGGAGNDTIYAGHGDDRIETGKDNDSVYFEGKEHGADTVTSEGGKTTFYFKDEYEGDGAKASEMYFSMERDEDNNKKCAIEIIYSEDKENVENGIHFSNFFNSKTGKYKNLTIVDAAGDTYSVSATKTAQSKVLSSANNNVLFTTNIKGNKVTTSTKNDIVYMMDSMNINDARDLARKDSITYTGGVDRYYSMAGDTEYNVTGFGAESNLSIYDNADLLKKMDPSEKEVTVAPSADDSIVFSDRTTASLEFLFDITKDGKVSSNTTFYVLNEKSDTLVKGIVHENGTVNGSVGIGAFFKEGQTFDNTADIYGNGRIEKFVTSDSSSFNYGEKIDEISLAVAGWFEGYTGDCQTAFAAIEQKVEGYDSLIACYIGNPS